MRDGGQECCSGYKGKRKSSNRGGFFLSHLKEGIFMATTAGRTRRVIGEEEGRGAHREVSADREAGGARGSSRTGAKLPESQWSGLALSWRLASTRWRRRRLASARWQAAAAAAVWQEVTACRQRSSSSGDGGGCCCDGGVLAVATACRRRRRRAGGK